MNDHNLHYEFNFTLGAPQPLADAQPLIAAPFDIWPLSEHNYLVRSSGNARAVILKRDVVMALGLCDRLRSLEAHVDTITQQLPHLQSHKDNVREVLADLLAKEFLVSAETLRHNLTRSADPQPTNAAIRSVYIRTCGRRQALPRLLDAWVNNTPPKPSTLSHCVIIDDSPDLESQRFVEQLVSNYQHQTDLKLMYFGLAARQRLTAWLATKLQIDAVTLDWLWGTDPDDSEPSYGKGVNLALALTAGQSFALIDDDALPTVYAAASPQSASTRFSSQIHSARFFETADVFDTHIQRLPLDPVHEHSIHLGASVDTYCHADDNTLTNQLFTDLDRDDLQRITPNSRVKITVNGLYGDPGTYGMGWAFHVDADSYADLISNPETYPQRLEQRYVWKGRKAPTVSVLNSHSLMTTTLTGIDNSELLLPTLPCGRCEDAVLGALTAVLYPDALQLELPWALPHIPETPRPWNRSLLDSPEPLPANLYLAQRLYDVALSTLSATPAIKVETLCTALHDLVSSGPALRADVEKALLTKRSHLIRSLNQQAQHHSDAPEFWRNDLMRSIQANIGLRPEDATQLDQQAALIRHRAEHFAAALAIWPQVWALCQATGEAELLAIATTP